MPPCGYDLLRDSSPFEEGYQIGREYGGMPYYTLVIEPGVALHAVADSRDQALILFEKELGQALSLQGDHPPAYLMDEWHEQHESPHWIHPTIPVFVVLG